MLLLCIAILVAVYYLVIASLMMSYMEDEYNRMEDKFNRVESHSSLLQAPYRGIAGLLWPITATVWLVCIAVTAFYQRFIPHFIPRSDK